MRMDPLARALFILYCVEAGVFLALAPWSPGWDLTILQVPWLGLQRLLANNLLRAAITGFGLVHIVWAAHDLELWLSEREARRSAAAEPQLTPKES